MFITDDYNRGSNMLTAGFIEPYLDIIELQEDWFKIERGMMKLEHIAIVNEDVELLNEGVSEFFKKIWEWIKKAALYVKNFFIKAKNWVVAFFKKLFGSISKQDLTDCGSYRGDDEIKCFNPIKASNALDIFYTACASLSEGLGDEIKKATDELKNASEENLTTLSNNLTKAIEKALETAKENYDKDKETLEDTVEEEDLNLRDVTKAAVDAYNLHIKLLGAKTVSKMEKTWRTFEKEFDTRLKSLNLEYKEAEKQSASNPTDTSAKVAVLLAKGEKDFLVAYQGIITNGLTVQLSVVSKIASMSKRIIITAARLNKNSKLKKIGDDYNSYYEDDVSYGNSNSRVSDFFN